MDIKQIGRKIRERRKLCGWGLDILSQKTGMNVSTLSKIEKGDISYTPSDETFRKIAEALDTTFENLKSEAGNFYVGFGACLWASSLLSLINTNSFPEVFNIAYKREPTVRNEDGEILQDIDVTKPIYHSKNGTTPNDGELLTAKELKGLLLEKKMDIIFIPGGSYEDIKDKVFRIGSIVNTVRGGVKLLTVGKKEKKDAEVVQDFCNNVKAYLYHSESTVAEQLANDIFLYNPKSNVELFPIEINNLEMFKKAFLQNLEMHKREGVPYIGYIGWEPHISYLKRNLDDEGIQCVNTFGFGQIVDPDLPFRHVTFDCVVMADKADFFKQSADFYSLFAAIDNATNNLNHFKMYPKLHRSIRHIAQNLQLEEKEALAELKKINFDINFSKDWVLNKPKTQL